MVVPLVHDLVNGLLNTIQFGFSVSFFEKVHLYSFLGFERVFLLQRIETAGILVSLSSKIEADFVVQVRLPLSGYLENQRPR